MPAPDAPPPDASSPVTPPAPPAAKRWQRIGTGLVAVEALAPLVAAVTLLVQLLGGSGVVARNELMVIGLCVVAAAGLAVVARGVWRANRAVRTAGVFWQVLMLGVVPAMWQAGQQVLAVAVVGYVALTAFAIVVGTGEGRAR